MNENDGFYYFYFHLSMLKKVYIVVCILVHKNHIENNKFIMGCLIISFLCSQIYIFS